MTTYIIIGHLLRKEALAVTVGFKRAYYPSQIPEILPLIEVHLETWDKY